MTLKREKVSAGEKECASIDREETKSQCRGKGMCFDLSKCWKGNVREETKSQCRGKEMCSIDFIREEIKSQCRGKGMDRLTVKR